MGAIVIHNSPFSKRRYIPIDLENLFIKVTVQFETEGNGQNEIVSHMDRSEVKL